MADNRQILETERLILRKLTPDDLEALFRLYRDPIIREHFPEGVLSREETQAELDWIIKVYMFAAEHPAPCGRRMNACQF